MTTCDIEFKSMSQKLTFFIASRFFYTFIVFTTKIIRRANNNKASHFAAWSSAFLYFVSSKSKISNYETVGWNSVLLLSMWFDKICHRPRREKERECVFIFVVNILWQDEHQNRFFFLNDEIARLSFFILSYH